MVHWDLFLTFQCVFPGGRVARSWGGDREDANQRQLRLPGVSHRRRQQIVTRNSELSHTRSGLCGKRHCKMLDSFYRPQRSCCKVMFYKRVSRILSGGGLCLSMHHRSHDQGGLCLLGLCQGGSLSGRSLSGGLCPGGMGLCPGGWVSVQGGSLLKRPLGQTPPPIVR